MKLSHQNIARFAAAAITCVFTACGTVSSEPSSAAPSIGKKFDRVIVKDFSHTVTDDDGTTPIAAKKFSDKIASLISTTSPGATVSRSGIARADTLVIEGEVTRYMEGNAALRMFVGMGAGSSYFDANVRLIDGKNGSTLNTIKVDKNSWGLGGGIAATQTVESFMNQGASVVAKEAGTMLK